MEVPDWCGTPDLQLQEQAKTLGFLSATDPDRFLRLQMRAFRPKTSRKKLALHADLTDFLEMPFHPALCPVRAFLQCYYSATLVDLAASIDCCEHHVHRRARGSRIASH